MTLWWVCVGVRPFRATTVDDIHLNIIDRNIQWPANVGGGGGGGGACEDAVCKDGGVEGSVGFDNSSDDDGNRNSGSDAVKHISAEALDLINKLLELEAETRLGSKSAGSVKEHPWFQKVDWLGLSVEKAEAVQREQSGDSSVGNDVGKNSGEARGASVVKKESSEVATIEKVEEVIARTGTEMTIDDEKHNSSVKALSPPSPCLGKGHVLMEKALVNVVYTGADDDIRSVKQSPGRDREGLAHNPLFRSPRAHRRSRLGISSSASSPSSSFSSSFATVHSLEFPELLVRPPDSGSQTHINIGSSDGNDGHSSGTNSCHSSDADVESAFASSDDEFQGFSFKNLRSLAEINVEHCTT
jgi:hypothetical protein